MMEAQSKKKQKQKLIQASSDTRPITYTFKPAGKLPAKQFDLWKPTKTTKSEKFKFPHPFNQPKYLTI